MSEDKEEQARPKAKKAQPVPVRVVGEKGHSALVQWRGEHGPRRAYVPREAVDGGRVDADVLGKGIEYGVAWERYLDLSFVTAEVLAGKLRKAGLWNLDDLQLNDRQIIQIGTNLIGQAVWDAANAAAQRKPPKRR